MKSYIVAFLLFLFQLTFAPTLPIEQKNKVYKEQIKMEIFMKSQLILEQKDHEDLIVIKSLKMTNKFTKEERIKVREICEELGIKPTWLYKVFKIESGGNPQAVNLQSGATGLIQWLPGSAVYCNTTTERLYKMNVLEQLNYVKYYLLIVNNGNKIKSFLDLYLAIFRPIAIGKPSNFILGHKGSIIVEQNKPFMNKDSTITVKSIKSFIALM